MSPSSSIPSSCFHCSSLGWILLLPSHWLMGLLKVSPRFFSFCSNFILWKTLFFSLPSEALIQIASCCLLVSAWMCPQSPKLNMFQTKGKTFVIKLPPHSVLLKALATAQTSLPNTGVQTLTQRYPFPKSIHRQGVIS